MNNTNMYHVVRLVEECLMLFLYTDLHFTERVGLQLVLCFKVLKVGMDVTKTKQNFYKLTKNFVNKGLIFNAKLTNTKISFRFYVKKFKQTDFNKNKRNRNPKSCKSGRASSNERLFLLSTTYFLRGQNVHFFPYITYIILYCM